MQRTRWVGLALAAAAFTLAYKQILDPDLFWHIAAGRWMWHHHHVVTEDPFSYIAGGQPWVSITWAYEIVVYLLSRHLRVVTAMHAALAAGMIALAWLTFLEISSDRSTSSIFAATLVFLAGMWGAQFRWVDRPEVFGQFFGVFMLFLLMREWRGRAAPARRPRLIAFGVLQILWANTHGTFLFGPGLAGLFWASTALERLLKKEKPWLRFRSKPALVFYVTLLACLANPRGMTGFRFPFHLLSVLTNPAYQLMISEAQNPFRDTIWHADTWAFVIWCGWLVTVPLIRAWLERESIRQTANRFSPGYFVLVAILIWVSISARRNIPFLILWTLPFVADSISRLVAEIWKIKTAPRIAFVASLLLPLLLCAATFTNENRATGERVRWGGKIEPYVFSQGAADFIKSHRSLGNVFSDVEFSDYMLFADPDFKPFIDGRFAEVYTTDQFHHFMDLLVHPRFLDQETERLRINVIALMHERPILRTLIHALAEDPIWRVAYFDESAVIFVRNAAMDSKSDAKTESENLFEKLIRVAMKSPWELSLLERLNSKIESDQARPLVQLAVILSLLGNADLSSKSLDAALAKAPDLPPAWSLKCTLDYLKCEKAQASTTQEMADQAEQSCEKAISFGADPVSVHQTLGLLYLNTGRKKEAVSSFKEVVRIDPLNYSGYFMLARANESVSDFEGAKAAFAKAANLRPFDFDALTELAKIAEREGDAGEALLYLTHARELASGTEQEPAIAAEIEKLQRSK